MANFRRCLGVYGLCLGMVLWVVSLGAMGQTVSTETTLQHYYLAYYGRAADPGGLDHWRALVDAAGSDTERLRTLDTVRASFGSPAQPEFASVYGQMDDATFLDRAYTNILNRTFDPEGRAYWAGEIVSRTQAFMQWGETLSDAQAKARADVLSLIINAALAGDPSSLDRRTIERSVELARYITQIVRDRGSEVAGLLDATRDLLAEADLGQQSLASLQVRVGDLIRGVSGRGSLQVTLEPAAARDSGAQWRRVGTERWFNSGEIETDIALGGQTIEFRTISGWAAPANTTVGISAGQTTELMRGYINATEAARLTRPQLVSATSNASDRASLSWLPAEDTQAPDASITYGVHLSDTAGFTPDVATAYHTVVDSPFAHISGLQPQTRYYVKITAQSANGGVSWSNELSVTTAATDPVLNPQQPATTVTAAETLAIDDTSVLVNAPPQPGDILVSEGGDGLFRKVTTVTPEGEAFRVVTEPAAMNELFDELLLSSETQLADLPTTSAASARVRTTRTPEGGELRQAYWPETGFRLTQETQPLSDHVLRRSASPPTRSNGIGELYDIENNKLRITGPVNVAVAPGTRIHINIDAQLINDPDHDYTLTDLELRSFKAPGLFSSTPEHTPKLTHDTDRAKSFTLDWTPQQHHVDDRSRPYTAEFRATAQKQDCGWSNFTYTRCHTHHVTLEVPIYIIWGELPRGEDTHFDSDNTDEEDNDNGGGHFDGEVNGEIRLSGDARVSFDPTLRVDSSIRRTTLERAEVMLDGRVRFELDARIAAKGAARATGSQRLLRKQFVKVFVVGTVPVVMRGDLTLTANLEASADAAMDIEQNITLGYDVTTGLIYTETGGWQVVQSAEPVYLYNLEGEADAEAHLKIALVPDLQISFYEAATGRLIIEPYLQADLALEGQFLYQQGQVWDYNDAAYRFTQLDLAGGVNAKLRADLSFFDVTIAGYPSRDADDFLEIALLDRTTIVGLSELGLQENGGSLADYPGAVGIQASVHDRALVDVLNFEPGSVYWQWFPTNTEFYLLPDPSENPHIVWACALNGGQHTLRFGGHSQLNVFIQQYEEIELNLPVCDPQGPLPDDPFPGTTGSLQVTLTPSAAVTAGAKWRRTGTSAWRNSGATESGIPVGGHTVQFEVIPNWTAPSNAAVSIRASEIATLTGSYTALGYTVTAIAEEGGSIAPSSLTVTEGNTTRFTVTPDSGYRIDTVTGCGGSLAGTLYTTGLITADCTVTATFTTFTTAGFVLNDTGIDWCVDGGGLVGFTNFLDCPVNRHPGQDGDYGRDALARAGQLQKFGAGAAGFDYTKLDANGNDLSASATNWSCVRDNHTGLIWEVKTDDGGLRDRDHTYTWYNPDPNTNGGHAGTQDGGTCTGSICDTLGLVEAVNAQGLCGATDWRLPNRLELRSILHFGRFDPAIDVDYFPHTASARFWSSSPQASDSLSALLINFDDGTGSFSDGSNSKDNRHTRVRLVRGGQ